MREVLPIRGTTISGFYGAPGALWRRALLAVANGLIRLSRVGLPRRSGIGGPACR